MRITGIIGLKKTGRKGNIERVIAHPFGHDYQACRQEWRNLTTTDAGKDYERLEMWDSGRGITKKNLRPGRTRVARKVQEEPEAVTETTGDDESTEDMASLLND